MSLPRRHLSILAVIAALLAAASAAPGAAQRVQGAAAKRAPDFTVRTVGGKTFRLSAQRGRVVVLDFLVPGCGECELQAPVLGVASRVFAARGVTVLILDVSGLGERDLRRFYYGQYRLGKTLVAPDRGLRVARAYAATALGTTVVVGRDGTIVWRGSWVGDEGRLFKAIRRALS
jgi:peroxiredoxin